MAATVIASSRGGYEHAFIDEVEEGLKCPICLHPLREPMQTPCGHLFCTSCLELQTRSGITTCPLDRQQFPENSAFPDQLHKRRVLCLKIKCTFRKSGCEWIGELLHLENHLQECPHGMVCCEYESVGCPEQIRPQDMAGHVEANVSRHMKLLLRRIQHLERENAHLRADHSSKSHSCTFFWRVLHWQHKLDQAEKNEIAVVYSEPFYTDTPGYKLRVELFPNGDERSKGRHLSIFLRLLKGDYDSIVRWPFAKQCKIVVMSQQSDTRQNDVPRSVNLSAGPQNIKDKALQRPQSEEQKRSFGFSTFLPLENLKSGNFIQDDCLIITVEIYKPT